MNPDHHSINTGGGQPPGSSEVRRNSLDFLWFLFTILICGIIYAYSLKTREFRMPSSNKAIIYLRPRLQLICELIRPPWTLLCLASPNIGCLQTYSRVLYLKCLCTDFLRERESKMGNLFRYIFLYFQSYILNINFWLRLRCTTTRK